MMRFLKSFMGSMLAFQGAGIVMLLLSGWILAGIQKDRFCTEQTFFTYQIHHFDDTPAWFVFVMAQFAINGLWLFRLAVLEGGVVTPTAGPFGYWGVRVPVNFLKLFAVNLVIIPACLFIFMLIRHANW